MTAIIWGVFGILLFFIVLLSFRLFLLQKAAREIEEAFCERLDTESNTLIGISSRNPHMLRLADSLNTQLKRLQAERHRFQQGDQELKQAVSNISHDLRTPLTAICGYLELLEASLKQLEASADLPEPPAMLTAEQIQTMKRYLHIIQERSELLSHLTEELFRYSIILMQQPEGEFVSLNQAIEEGVAAYYHALRNRGITPVIHLPKQPILCCLNPSALARILANLLSNALKYSDGDLEITLSEEGKITFSNHAAALNEVQVGQLFDRFYTVENARNATGLGLSIAKALAGQTGGTMSAWYEDGTLYVCVEFPIH